MQGIVYMGAEDIQRQSLNVYRMRLLGAEVISVGSGTQTLKDAINEALRDWVTNVETTHYLIGSVVGPHPYPLLVRDFQSVIGREAREQFLEARNALPDCVVACVRRRQQRHRHLPPVHPRRRCSADWSGGGGHGVDTGQHSATLSAGRPGVLHGSMSYLLQDQHGQVVPTHSISPDWTIPASA